MLRVVSRLSPITSEEVIIEDATSSPAIINAACLGLRRICSTDKRNITNRLGENTGCIKTHDIIPADSVHPQVANRPTFNQPIRYQVSQESITGPTSKISSLILLFTSLRRNHVAVALIGVMIQITTIVSSSILTPLQTQ